MSTLYTFGCSFTAEYFPVGDPIVVSSYDHYKKWRGGNLPDVWPTLLGLKMGYETKNRAVGGASNYLILKQFMEFATHIKPNDVLIFGWTQMARFQLVNLDEDKFNQILPCDDEFTGVGVDRNALNQIFVNRTHPLWHEELLLWIEFINLFVHNVGAHVFHWTSDIEFHQTISEKYYWDHRFIKPLPNDRNLDLMGSICNLFDDNGEKIKANILEETNHEVKDGHFGEIGHRKQADVFFDYIKQYVKITKFL